MDNHIQQRRYMPIKCATIHQNRIWISSYLYNSLYSFNYVDNNMEYMGKFENQDMRDNLHRQMIQYGNTLFFIPAYADGIDVYNIKEHCFEETIKYRHNKKMTNIVTLQISDEVVWLFPQNVKESPYILNTKDRKIELLSGWKQEIDKIFSDDESYLVSVNGICTDGKNIYAAIFNKGIILKINRDTLEIRKIFSDEEYRFASINCIEETLYLTELESTEIVQIEENKVIDKIRNKEIYDVSIPYCGMVPVVNGFLAIPYHLNDFYLFDTKEKILRKVDISFKKKDGLEPCFFSWQIYEGNVFLFPARAQSVLIVNCHNLAVQTIDLNIPDDITDQWILNNKFDIYYRLGNGILNEADFSLKEFINLIERGKRKVINDAGYIGEEIYISVNRE